MMGFYIQCPFYLTHRNWSASITCEDTQRWYRTKELRDRHIDTVCEKNWKDCPHAQKLLTFYERTESMNLTRKEREHLELTCESQKTEMAKLKKQIHKLDKDLDAKDREIRALEYLEQSKDKKVKSQAEKIFLMQEEIRGLLALIGYGTDAAGMDSFTLNRVQQYAKKWDVRYRVEPYEAEDGVKEINRIYIERTEKKDGESHGEEDQ